MAGIYIDENDYVSTAMWPIASLALRKSRSDRGHQGIEVEMLYPRRRFLPSRVRLEDLDGRKYVARTERTHKS